MRQIYKDSKPRTVMPSWLILARDKAIFFVVWVAIVLILAYVVPGPLSRAFVQFGNMEFSAGNDNLGMASYRLARLFNGDLKESVDQCYASNLQKQYELAIGYCSKALAIDPNYAQAYSYRGYAYLSLNKYDQAIADFTSDIGIIPVATRSYINRGTVYMEEKKYDLAIADFTNSIDINPKEPQPYLNRGVTYAMQGNGDLAVPDCNKAIELGENGWNVYFCLGLAFIDQQKYGLAINNLNTAIGLAPSTVRSDIYCVQGATYTKMGEFQLAITSLERGVKLDVAGENEWCKSVLENAHSGIPTP